MAARQRRPGVLGGAQHLHKPAEVRRRNVVRMRAGFQRPAAGVIERMVREDVEQRRGGAALRPHELHRLLLLPLLPLLLLRLHRHRVDAEHPLPELDGPDAAAARRVGAAGGIAVRHGGADDDERLRADRLHRPVGRVQQLPVEVRGPTVLRRHPGFAVLLVPDLERPHRGEWRCGTAAIGVEAARVAGGDRLDEVGEVGGIPRLPPALGERGRPSRFLRPSGGAGADVQQHRDPARREIAHPPIEDGEVVGGAAGVRRVGGGPAPGAINAQLAVSRTIPAPEATVRSPHSARSAGSGDTYSSAWKPVVRPRAAGAAVGNAIAASRPHATSTATATRPTLPPAIN